MLLRSGKMVGADEKRRRILAAAIPDDLLISEVLARLPARSLARCRCVCRSWCAGTAGIAFARRHLELSRVRAPPPPPSVLVIPREVDADDDQTTSAEISFHRLLLPPPGRTEVALMLEKAWPGGVTRLIYPTHCDGLVAVATTTDTVFVCNPATSEFVALPPGSRNAELDRLENMALPVALGFDRWRNSYVVARYFYRTYGRISYDEISGQRSQDYDIGHEVFTLAAAAGGAWELTQDPPHAVGIERPICTRRAFYWHSEVPTPRLMRFGLRDRAFDVVSRPPTGWSAMDDMTELEDGKLCYVHAAAEASFQVWLADETPELRWSLRCRIDLADPDPNCFYNLMPVAADGDVLVAITGEKVCRYNMRNGSVEEVVDKLQLQYRRPDGSNYMCQSYYSIRYVVPYVESLVSPRG